MYRGVVSHFLPIRRHILTVTDNESNNEEIPSTPTNLSSIMSFRRRATQAPPPRLHPEQTCPRKSHLKQVFPVYIFSCRCLRRYDRYDRFPRVAARVAAMFARPRLQLWAG